MQNKILEKTTSNKQLHSIIKFTFMFKNKISKFN